jgi:hypothetical protein
MSGSVMTWPILSVTTFLPVVGAVLVYLIAMPSGSRSGPRS